MADGRNRGHEIPQIVERRSSRLVSAAWQKGLL